MLHLPPGKIACMSHAAIIVLDDRHIVAGYCSVHDLPKVSQDTLRTDTSVSAEMHNISLQEISSTE